VRRDTILTVAESIAPDPRRNAHPASGEEAASAHEGASPVGHDGGSAPKPPGPPSPTSSQTSLISSTDPARDLPGALHEVSNALTVVLGWIERAREASGAPAEVEHALDIAAGRASQARSIVRRAIGAEVHAEPPASVAAVVADAVTGLEPELRRAGIHALQQVSPAVLDRSVAHAPTVLQILTNLLLNAIAMSPPGSTVRVDAGAAVGSVIFAVTDEGPGIPLERRRTLFDAGLSTRAGGAGIGLRHAAALARSLGGALALGELQRGGLDGGSRPQAPGARFELTWPLPPAGSAPRPPESGAQRLASRATEPSTPVSRSRSMPLAGTRILLVEDDDAVVDLLDTALTARGADVVSIRHQRELEGALATGPFDAALFDISPIQEDVQGAVALVRGARGACSEHSAPSARGTSGALRVVLISGSAEKMPEMPSEWVAAWVRKPFEVAEILQAIEPAVSKS
jgi:CheY-like chemotaxis protein